MSTITNYQIRVLRHMLGATNPQEKEIWGYRDHFCVEPESRGHKNIKGLEDAGMIQRDLRYDLPLVYHSTEKGRAFIGLSEEQYESKSEERAGYELWGAEKMDRRRRKYAKEKV